MDRIGFWEYESERLKRAVRDTWLFIRAKYWWGIPPVIIAAGLRVALSSPASLSETIGGGLLYGLAAIVITAILAWFYYSLRAPFRIHLKQVEENERLQSDLSVAQDEISALRMPYDDLVPGMDAWEVLSYILDETDSGIGKEWHEIAGLLRNAAHSTEVPIAVSGKRSSGLQRDPIDPGVFGQNDLVIEPNGVSWVGERQSTSEMFRNPEGGRRLYDYIKFVQKQIEVRWPRSVSPRTTKPREMRLLRALDWIIHHSGGTRQRRTEPVSAVPTPWQDVSLSHPVWSELEPFLHDPEGIPKQELTAEALRAWLSENRKRLKKEWDLS